MSDLPPPRSGDQSGWQPPAGPPLVEGPSAPTPVRPYLPDPRAPHANQAPPEPSTLLAPIAPLPPLAPIAPLPPFGVPLTTEQASMAQTSSTTDPTSMTAAASKVDTAVDVETALVAMPAPTAPQPAHSSAPTTRLPATPESPAQPPPPATRSRVPAVAGAIVAVALGAGAVLWVTRSSDNDPSDRSNEEQGVATTEATDAEATTLAESSSSVSPTTSAPVVVLPTTSPTAPPTTPPATTPPSTTPASAPAVNALPSPPVPPGATLFSDPAGWTIVVDPAWQREDSPQFAGWFTGTGSTGFNDNVNVVMEDLPGALSLDEYVVAATGVIDSQATDVEIVDQRRFVGDDGVEVHVVIWLGTVVGANQRLGFVQAMTVTPTRAYVATFTAQPGSFAGLATAVGPYLTTLRGT